MLRYGLYVRAIDRTKDVFRRDDDIQSPRVANFLCIFGKIMVLKSSAWCNFY